MSYADCLVASADLCAVQARAACPKPSVTDGNGWMDWLYCTGDVGGVCLGVQSYACTEVYGSDVLAAATGGGGDEDASVGPGTGTITAALTAPTDTDRRTFATAYYGTPAKNCLINAASDGSCDDEASCNALLRGCLHEAAGTR